MLTPRQSQAVDMDGSLCVTAGAGTGKTKVLVDRYLRLLEEGKASVSGILALTFTEKAAAEMRERVRRSLMERGPPCEELLEEFHWASISTFHAFCARLLREFPVESGLDPGFRVLEEVQADRLIEEAFQELIYQGAGAEAEEALVPLLSIAGQWRVRQYLTLLYRKRQATERAFAALQSPAQAREWWETMRAQHRDVLVRGVWADGELMGAMAELRDLAGRYAGDADRGMSYLREASPFLEGLRKEVGEERFLHALIDLYAVKGARNYGSQKNFGADLERFQTAYGTMKGRLQDVHDLEDELEVEDGAYVEHASRFLYRLKLAFSAFLGIVRRMKRERNAIDFDDMLLAVRSTLVDFEGVRASVSKRYRYLLIDEFQDTDRVQVEIVRMILGDEKDKLFVVGDAKQSIYLFRQVDVSVFKEVQGFINGDLSGDTVDLDVNHRSTPEVVCFVNILFDRIMDKEDRPWEFRYSRIEPSPDRMGQKGSVELMLVPEPAQGGNEKMAQAKMVARKVLNIVGEGAMDVYWHGRDRSACPRAAEYRDITILLRSRTNLRFYEKQLREHGIPYHVHSGMGFFARQEIADIYLLLRFLNNPLDDVSLYGVLRSPYFGLSDSELFWMCEGSKRSLYMRLKEKATSDPRLERCWASLHRWEESSRRLPVGELLTDILEGSGIYGVYAGLDEGDQMIANLDKLRSLVRSAQAEGFFALPDLVLMLRLRTDEDLREGQAQIDPESGNSVNLMTIHAAKGLEFPIVIVPELEAKGMEDHDLLIIDDDDGIGLKVPHPRTMEMRPSALKRRLDRTLGEKQTAERRRLLYVACTRAKDHLVLCGLRPNEKRLSRDGKDWMVWTWQALDMTEDDVLAGGKDLQDRGRKFRLAITTTLPGGSMPPPLAPPMLSVPSGWPEWRPMERRIIVAEEMVVLSPSKDPEAPATLEDLKGFTTSAVADAPDMRGNIMHEVMQGKDAALVLRTYGQDDPTGERARKLLAARQRFLDSPLMREAVVDRREQPFEIVQEGKLVSGRMDRLVQTKDGQWHVIDFKSGMVSISKAKEKAKEHAPQMMAYRKAAEAMLGHPVRAYLYFTETATFEEFK